ncbi:hypothetical protein [Halostagnicola kamekurae]|uniref:Uncharacterized protein n=1 Tax=Halostagnicola kamekurae TaxID=619731 RepID=A0A1I6PRB8_9EURY|nr:hypothetical protein [Halostagnicola kamekurae]SFS42741.1 hypothetical protein SAMN04488556_0736 [Halostagnicola kamekurae]
MSRTTYQCTCGAVLEYKQDLVSDRGTTGRTWKCRQCATPVPGIVAEKIGHQHPS